MTKCHCLKIHRKCMDTEEQEMTRLSSLAMKWCPSEETMDLTSSMEEMALDKMLDPLAFKRFMEMSHLSI